jgi:hypothetical protein
MSEENPKSDEIVRHGDDRAEAPASPWFFVIVAVIALALLVAWKIY